MTRKGTMIEINHDENGEFSQRHQQKVNVFSKKEELYFLLCCGGFVILLAFAGYGIYRAIGG